jgi:psiF repeat
LLEWSSWSPWGLANVTTHPSAATACDNGVPSKRRNIFIWKRNPIGLIHARFSIVARRCASLQPEVLPMMTLSSRAAATAIASLLLVGSAFAQTPAPATPAPAAKPPVVHSAASVECSKEADAKGLHGKERKKFRSECKRQAKEGAATKQ